MWNVIGTQVIKCIKKPFCKTMRGLTELFKRLETHSGRKEHTKQEKMALNIYLLIYLTYL